jgi:hypothetical protein
MATVFERYGAFHPRLYSSINLATGQPNEIGPQGKPLRKQQYHCTKVGTGDDTGPTTTT